MINVFALCLLLTSSFLSPNQEKQNPNKEDVIVKEGHRVVVVEYEKGDGNTKVLISPQDTHVADNEKGYVSSASEKVSEKMYHAKEEMEETARGFSPRELVCDAYGKCKHKIVSAIGKGKETVESLEEKSEDVVGNVKDSVSKVSDKFHETEEIVKDVSSKTKDKIVEKSGEMKGKVTDAIDSTKKLKENVENEGRRKMEGVKEMVREKAEKVVEDTSDRLKQGASEAKNEAKKELSEILRLSREVLYDVFSYVVSPMKDSVSGVLHLMGFSAAYGLCVWITFASSYVLAGALPRHQFAMVQSKIYPVYFKAMAYSLGLALLGHLLCSKRFSLFDAWSFQGFNLSASLGMVFANLMYLEPRATKVLFERMKKEKESNRTDSITEVRTVDSSLGETAGRVTTASQDKAKEAEGAKSEILRLSEILKNLNSYSSFLNALTLMSLTAHLVYLGQRMNISC